MIEYGDVDERRRALARLAGVEHQVWTQIAGQKIFAIANEDLERSTDEKTSAVHFLRFQLSAKMIAAVKQGHSISFGIDHDLLDYNVEVNEVSRRTLAADLATD